MSTLLKVHTSSVNNVPTQDTTLHQAQDIMYNMFWTKLKAAGWVVKGSSDATTANTSDNLTGTTKFTWQSAGNAHSWGWLEAPSGEVIDNTSHKLQVILCCSTGSANPHLINVTIAAGTFTIGSTTADPTTAATNKTFTNQQIVPSTVANSKWHSDFTSIGDFAFFISQDGTSRFTFSFGIQLPTTQETSVDYYPHMIWSAYTTTSTGAFSAANVAATTTSIAFWIDGASTVANGNFGPYVYNIISTGVPAQYTSTGSAISGKYPAFPIIWGSKSATTLGTRGYVADIEFAPTGSGVVEGTVEPATGTTTTAIFGEFWVANGGNTPTP